jgi:excisionase family DNA binding protein
MKHAPESSSETPDVREFLTAEEAAELLQLASKTIYALAAAGDLPGAAKVGGALRIHKPTLLLSFAPGKKSGSRSPMRRSR